MLLGRQGLPALQVQLARQALLVEQEQLGLRDLRARQVPMELQEVQEQPVLVVSLGLLVLLAQQAPQVQLVQQAQPEL